MGLVSGLRDELDGSEVRRRRLRVLGEAGRLSGDEARRDLVRVVRDPRDGHGGLRVVRRRIATTVAPQLQALRRPLLSEARGRDQGEGRGLHRRGPPGRRLLGLLRRPFSHYRGPLRKKHLSESDDRLRTTMATAPLLFPVLRRRRPSGRRRRLASRRPVVRRRRRQRPRRDRRNEVVRLVRRPTLRDATKRRVLAAHLSTPRRLLQARRRPGPPPLRRRRRPRPLPRQSQQGLPRQEEEGTKLLL
mmetsp:Transcript_23587/g.75707  ORF Transcript_23587/g.75707 Transcript_23587/m.75707 type:complete len:246 (-) Transcript_23587:1568-2305(-)